MMMEEGMGMKDTELLCLNVVETINTYFDKYPKGKILKKDYEEMLGKISKQLLKLEEDELGVSDGKKEPTEVSYIG